MVSAILKASQCCHVFSHLFVQTITFLLVSFYRILIFFTAQLLPCSTSWCSLSCLSSMVRGDKWGFPGQLHCHFGPGTKHKSPTYAKYRLRQIGKRGIYFWIYSTAKKDMNWMLKIDYSWIQQLLLNHILCIRLFVAEPSPKSLYGLERHKRLGRSALLHLCRLWKWKCYWCNLVISPLPPPPTNSNKKKYTSVSVG